MHKLHTEVVKEALCNKKKILSFFRDRYASEDYPEDKALITTADYIITDSQEVAPSSFLFSVPQRLVLPEFLYRAFNPHEYKYVCFSS